MTRNHHRLKFFTENKWSEKAKLKENGVSDVGQITFDYAQPRFCSDITKIAGLFQTRFLPVKLTFCQDRPLFHTLTKMWCVIISVYSSKMCILFKENVFCWNTNLTMASQASDLEKPSIAKPWCLPVFRTEATEAIPPLIYENIRALGCYYCLDEELNSTTQLWTTIKMVSFTNLTHCWEQITQNILILSMTHKSSLRKKILPFKMSFKIDSHFLLRYRTDINSFG